MKEICKISLAILLLFGFCLLAHAHNKKVDIALCNLNEACLQDFEIAQIKEQINEINTDINAISKSLNNLGRYYDLWPKCEESQSWAESQKEFVCFTTNQLKTKISKIRNELENLKKSRYLGIVQMAEEQLRILNDDLNFKAIFTNSPCKRATEFCNRYF